MMVDGPSMGPGSWPSAEALAADAAFTGSYQTRIGVGAPKAGGGGRGVGIPGTPLGTVSTRSQTANQSRYYKFTLPAPVLVDQLTFEVTAAPASNANVRAGLTLADVDWQPIGVPLIDESVAVASGFTGVKTASPSVAVLLAPGKYLLRTNVDVAMTLRQWWLPQDGLVDPALGANSNPEFVYLSETFGAMTTPAAKWTTWVPGNLGQFTPLLLRWTDPLG
jgi:hypothetical protein